MIKTLSHRRNTEQTALYSRRSFHHYFLGYYTHSGVNYRRNFLVWCSTSACVTTCSEATPLVASRKQDQVQTLLVDASDPHQPSTTVSG